MSNLIQDYTEWLTRKSIIVEASDEWTQLITPYLKFNNDQLEIFFRQEADNKITFSDDQQTLRELEMKGLTLEAPHFSTAVDRILRAYGVRRVGEELTLTAALDNKETALHRFLEAVRNVLDLHVLAMGAQNLSSSFSDDIDDWLRSKRIPFLRNPSFFGQSGLANTFDFAVPSADNHPEQLIRVISNPQKDRLIGAVIVIQDTLAVRPGSNGLVVIDDRQVLTTDVLETLTAYSIPHVRRSDQERMLQILRSAA